MRAGKLATRGLPSGCAVPASVLEFMPCATFEDEKMPHLHRDWYRGARIALLT